ncbi:tautomerase family protein [Lactonifactor longoviformis]|uniref:tautomerase family protein n=1 Tax=Lactonifactor longoviformis TaxID=341220 RepID=UPI0036F44207
MPYIAIKAFPKDEETKRRTIEKINQVFLESWGCPQEAVTISFEEIQPQDWDEKVRNSEILPQMDKMMILDGKKTC